MTNYRSNTALGGSDLRAMVSDFDKWLFERELLLSGQLPDWMVKESSPAAEFGTIVHRALLEPWHYERDIVMPYVESFATKEGKTVKAESLKLAELAGSNIIRHEHAWAVDHIRKNFHAMRHEEGLHDVSPDTTEIELYSEANGIPLKGKLDWYANGILLDVKTISDWKRRGEVMFSSYYHVQLAHYESLPLVTPEALGVVWVESVAPYRVELQILEDSVAQMGRIARDKAMQRYRDYLDGEVVF